MRSIVISLLAFLAFSECYSQNDFAQWRGPDRNGIYPEKNLLDRWPDVGPQLLWKYDNLGRGYSSPAVTGTKIWTIGMIDSISYIFNFDHQGKLLWKKPLETDYTGDYPGTYSTPTICDDLGYVVNGLGVLYCFDAGTGNIRWKIDMMKEFKGQPGPSGFLDNLLVDGEKLYCTPGGAGRHVVALNRRSGDVIWSSAGESVVDTYCSPILIEKGGKRLFIYITSKSLIALDSNNGIEMWKVGINGRALPQTPVYRDGFILFSDYRNGSFKLKVSEDGQSIQEVWKTRNMILQMGEAIVLGDRVYARGKQEKFYCVDWNTGQELYSEPAKGMVTTLISAEGLLYCYDMEGNFSLRKPVENRLETVGSFTVLGGTKDHCSHPVIKDGKLYIRHDNSLFVYNIAKELK